MERKELFAHEAVKIVQRSESKGIILRFMGAAAIWMRAECSSVREKLSTHREISDLDFMTYGKYWGDVTKLMQEMGYNFDKRHAVMHGHKRLIFRGTDDSVIPMIDIFFDKLEYCHTIDFAKDKRLEIDNPTISLADLLLEKMQIVELNEKDIIDTMILLSRFNIGNDDDKKINGNYIADLLSKDWGFYYTVTTNLKKIRSFFLREFEKRGLLTEEDGLDIRLKIDALLNAIEKKPKTLSWKLRARIGPSKKWYRDVEEVVR